MKRFPAILIVGTTGAGKTPLGDRLEVRGLHGRPCAHFDFGRELRSAATENGRPGAALAPDEIAFVRDVLRRNELLDDEHFYIAFKLLRRFLNALQPARLAPACTVVLNGLPRHVGQARDIAPLVDVRLVVHLDCPPDVAWARIRVNAGGERDGRDDDSPESMRSKQELFQRRTLPLLDYYREAGAVVVVLPVGSETTADELIDGMESDVPQASAARIDRRQTG